MIPKKKVGKKEKERKKEKKRKKKERRERESKKSVPRRIWNHLLITFNNEE